MSCDSKEQRLKRLELASFQSLGVASYQRNPAAELGLETVYKSSHLPKQGKYPDLEKTFSPIKTRCSIRSSGLCIIPPVSQGGEDNAAPLLLSV